MNPFSETKRFIRYACDLKIYKNMKFIHLLWDNFTFKKSLWAQAGKKLIRKRQYFIQLYWTDFAWWTYIDLEDFFYVFMRLLVHLKKEMQKIKLCYIVYSFRLNFMSFTRYSFFLDWLLTLWSLVLLHHWIWAGGSILKPCLKLLHGGTSGFWKSP